MQCAVGNRCKKCASRFTSHVLQVTPRALIGALLASSAVGIGFGFLEPALIRVGYGIYGYLIEFAGAYALGRLVHRAAKHKLGAKVAFAVLGGLLLGLALGPTRDIFLQAMAATSEEDVSSRVGDHCIHVAILIAGVLTPFVRKN